MIDPANIHLINKDIECAVLAILNLLSRDDADLKELIGKVFLQSAHLRLEKIKKYNETERAIQWHLEKNQIKKIREL